MTNDPFTHPDITESEVSSAIEVASNQIEEAENILWAVTNQTESTDCATEIEAVTRDIWEIQNQLADIQQNLIE
jgi:predicted  nucleic acid-binding Zn-ribbon protein